MKHINLLSAVLCLSEIMSCGKKETVTEVLTEQNEQQIIINDIELENGQRWQVNEEMKPHIKASEALFFDYINSQDNDHKKLAQDLKAHADALIKSCTMEGKAHDELHKWLHPYLQRVKELEEVEFDDQVTTKLSEIKATFEIYHQNFQ